MLGPYWVPTREDLVTDIEDSVIYEAIGDGYSVVVDATNLKGLIRFQSIINMYYPYNIYAEEKSFLDISLEECIRRDSLREEPVGEEVIRGMVKKYNL